VITRSRERSARRPPSASYGSATTAAAKASIPSITASKRMEESRSNECSAPGSSTQTTGLPEALRARSASARARREEVSVSLSPWTMSSRRDGSVGLLEPRLEGGVVAGESRERRQPGAE
jgi:hypothetical protein